MTDGISHGFNDLHPGINQYINHLTITARLNILILSLVALLTPFLLLSRPSSLNLQFYRSLYGMNAASPENALTNGIYSIHRIRHASFHVISTSPQPQLLSCKVAWGVRKKAEIEILLRDLEQRNGFLWVVGKRTAGTVCGYLYGDAWDEPGENEWIQRDSRVSNLAAVSFNCSPLQKNAE